MSNVRLDSFREILIKKATNDEVVGLVKYIREDLLTDIILESLEKMARGRHKGDSANMALRDFGVEMDPELEPKMIYDALSHHASQYKSALKAGRDSLANEHARQLFKIMDMADQAQKHTGGKLSVEAVSPHAWERQSKLRQYTPEDAPVQRGTKKAGQFVTDTKGWRYRGKDYSFLQGPPHESYVGEVRKHGHTGAYPLEHIRVNGKYLDIQDVPPEDLKGFKPHEFDKHPILEHFSTPAHKHDEIAHSKYKQAEDEYLGSPHVESWWNKHSKLMDDKESYAKRGSKPSEPVHPELPENDKLQLPPTTTERGLESSRSGQSNLGREPSRKMRSKSAVTGRTQNIGDVKEAINTILRAHGKSDKEDNMGSASPRKLSKNNNGQLQDLLEQVKMCYRKQD